MDIDFVYLATGLAIFALLGFGLIGYLEKRKDKI